MLVTAVDLHSLVSSHSTAKRPQNAEVFYLELLSSHIAIRFLSCTSHISFEGYVPVTFSSFKLFVFGVDLFIMDLESLHFC